MQCDVTPLISWLAVIGAAATVGAFFAGAAWATRKAERMIRGGRPKIAIEIKASQQPNRDAQRARQERFYKRVLGIR